jgi:hypothetical protein
MMATKKAKSKARKPRKKPLDWDAVYTQRGKALGDMESEVCTLADFGEIAFHLGDAGEPVLFAVAVDHLVEKLRQFKAHYFAVLKGNV